MEQKGDIMHLDETMLQSNTAIYLVEYINKIFGELEYPSAEQVENVRKINEKHAKAIKRRSIKYRTDLK